MLVWITKKEYRKLKEKYLDLQDVLEEKNYVISKMSEDLDTLTRKKEEYTYRETLREKEISDLNNAITNLLDNINELNVKLASKPKRGRPKKEKEEK